MEIELLLVSVEIEMPLENNEVVLYCKFNRCQADDELVHKNLKYTCDKRREECSLFQYIIDFRLFVLFPFFQQKT
jgi:hypothetical protein